ncbi:MAG TPA: hypothetical protein VFB72_19705 [Verrucomicrobiae bacterium]|nr:hypothetical protein [Verrucomicrobiae bacterium]
MKTSSVHWNISAAKVEEAKRGSAKRWRKSWMSRLCALLDHLAPVGYEDDEGFHYGKPAIPPKNDWLS